VIRGLTLPILIQWMIDEFSKSRQKSRYLCHLRKLVYR
jgi:hypothetical protein